MTAYCQSQTDSNLYESPQKFTMATLDGYIVRDRENNRNIPIFIRYPKEASGQLPLILWSHGGGPKDTGKYQNREWGQLLAESGYIVIHMSHLERSRAEANALYREFNLSPRQGQRAFSTLEVDRPRDATAVLNNLDAIEKTFPEIAGKIDRDRVGVAGHSFGSYTAMLMGGARATLTEEFADLSFKHPLPKAILALSPQGPGRFGFEEDSWRELNLPVMSATGAADETPGEVPEDRVMPFSLMPPGEKYLFFINDEDADHATFNLGNKQHPEFSKWLGAAGVAFFDSALKNSAEARAYLVSGTTEAISNNVASIRSR
ncbi:MAG: hypothetical protein JNN15_18165 [Blastocatellia bacterium]|nr:hypothetical protein [Blastocatellia bacterium]